MKEVAMTETKDTTQTMRARLRQHGLPEAWAEWCTSLAVNTRAPDHHTVTLEGNGVSLKCESARATGPWLAVEGNGNGSAVFHGFIRGDGWIKPAAPKAPAPDPDAAHWEAVAEKAHAELAELRGALAVAVRERDMATASERRMWSTMLSAQMERDGLRELVASLLRPTQSKPAAQLRELCLEMAANLTERAGMVK